MPVPGTAVGSKGGYKKRYKKMASKWYNKKYSVGEIAVRALRGVNYMKTLINSEMKQYELTSTANVVDYTGTILQLSNIAQGDTTSTREGRSILMNYLNIRGVITRVSSSSILRMIVFQDTQQNGVVPSTDQVLSTVGDGYAPFSGLEPSFAGRFKILSSNTISLSDQNPLPLFKIFKKHVSHVKWQTTADGGNPMKGHIYMLLVSNAGPADPNRPQVDFRSKLGFRDN